MRANHVGRVLLATAASMALAGCQWIPGTDAFLIRKAHLAVGEKLLDPYSAKFSDESVLGDPAVVCGWVNSKNSYGGYVGRTAYMWPGLGPASIMGAEPDFPALSQAQADVAAYGGSRMPALRLKWAARDTCSFAQRWETNCKGHAITLRSTVEKCEAWKGLLK